MAEIKLSATILLPGANMVSYQQAHRVKETVFKRRGVEYTKKETVKIPEMFDNFSITVEDSRGKEHMNVQIRKCIPAKQVLYISDEAVEAWTSKEKPATYTEAQPWLKLTRNQKILWHLDRIANDLGGIVGDFAFID